MKALVPLDGSPNALRIFSTVRRLLALQPAFEVHLVSVLDPKDVHGRSESVVAEPPAAAMGRTTVTSPLPRVVESHGEALERRTIESREWLEGLGHTELPAATVIAHTAWSSNAAEAINGLANELDADVIVMATHGRTGLAHLFAGSVTEGVVRNSTRPVLVQGPHAD